MSKPRPTGPEAAPLNGLLLIDKSQGWTSHDAVAKARGLTGQRRIGHSGTLDPMATGLLVLCLGMATRLVEYISGHAKRYEGVITLGATTDTDDAEGTVVARAPVPALEDAVLRAIERAFSGVLQQVPPAYSAIKTDGQRAYAVARRGGTVDLPARPVTVNRLELAQIDEASLSIAVDCGPGTYIRSLARDIGAALGCGGHLSALRRTAVAHFDVRDAVTIAELALATEAGLAADLLIPADEGMIDAGAAVVSDEHALAIGHGLRFAVEAARTGQGIRVYDGAGTFLAVASVDADGLLRAGTVFETAHRPA